MLLEHGRVSGKAGGLSFLNPSENGLPARRQGSSAEASAGDVEDDGREAHLPAPQAIPAPAEARSDRR